MTVANLGVNTHRPTQLVNGNPVQLVRQQRASHQVTAVTHRDLPLLAIDLDHVKRRTGGHT